MLAARMYDYNQPLVLEEVKKPDIAADQVLVRVEAGASFTSAGADGARYLHRW